MLSPSSCLSAVKWLRCTQRLMGWRKIMFSYPAVLLLWSGFSGWRQDVHTLSRAVTFYNMRRFALVLFRSRFTLMESILSMCKPSRVLLKGFFRTQDRTWSLAQDFCPAVASCIACEHRHDFTVTTWGAIYIIIEDHLVTSLAGLWQNVLQNGVKVRNTRQHRRIFLNSEDIEGKHGCPPTSSTRGFAGFQKGGKGCNWLLGILAASLIVSVHSSASV